MVLRFVFFAFAYVPLLAWTQAANGSDDLVIQRDALAAAFERPLRAQLLRQGYTPRNAAIAANSLLDVYAQCLTTQQSPNLNPEPEVTHVRLGDEVIATDKSPCLTEFLNNVAGLP